MKSVKIQHIIYFRTFFNNKTNKLKKIESESHNFLQSDEYNTVHYIAKSVLIWRLQFFLFNLKRKILLSPTCNLALGIF